MKIKSFTLIELLVVIVIIGILAGVIIVSTSSSISKANFAKAQAFSNTVQQELLLNLVSEWTFDEGNAEDSWGNNDGVVTGATYVQKSENRCVYGGCYSFNGTNSYIETAVNNDLNFGTGDFTYTIWFNVINKALTQIMIRSSYGGVDGQGIYIQNNIFYVHSRTSATGWIGVGSNNIENNTWNHGVLIRKNNVVYGFLNGASLSASGVAGANFNCVDNLKTDIGTHITYSHFFGGLLDDIRVYNTALSISQIKEQYIAGLNSLLANNNISKEEYNQRLESLSINY